jgi:glutamate-5-semialdehyde dehydrogenase
MARNAKAASRATARLTSAQKSRWLNLVAARLHESREALLHANRLDVDAAPGYGLSEASVDRLRLTPDRLEALRQAVVQIDALPDPVGELIDGGVRPNGLRVHRVRVPLGVIFFIYESRPGVTVDAAALCVKSGNAVILRGGKEARHSNQALADLLRDAAGDAGLPRDAVQLVETLDRAAVGEFLALPEYITVAIPRGGRSLIERVAAEARMPVIKHFDGICHVYVDRAAPLERACALVINAKCQRPGVCNAAETLLVHREVAAPLFERLMPELRARQVEIRGCPETCRLVPGSRPAEERDFRTEHLALILNVRVVAGLDEAIEHIETFGSHHSDAIVTDSVESAERFTAEVDSAAVLVNASTRFHDGGELGLGAEIGISTDRFHARGPCGLRELTTYKYVIAGQGQTRS